MFYLLNPENARIVAKANALEKRIQVLIQQILELREWLEENENVVAGLKFEAQKEQRRLALERFEEVKSDLISEYYPLKRVAISLERTQSRKARRDGL